VCFVLTTQDGKHAFCSRYDFGPWPLLSNITTLPEPAAKVRLAALRKLHGMCNLRRLSSSRLSQRALCLSMTYAGGCDMCVDICASASLRAFAALGSSGAPGFQGNRCQRIPVRRGPADGCAGRARAVLPSRSLPYQARKPEAHEPEACRRRQRQRAPASLIALQPWPGPPPCRVSYTHALARRLPPGRLLFLYQTSAAA
jgi:hypothetical protein